MLYGIIWVLFVAVSGSWFLVCHAVGSPGVVTEQAAGSIQQPLITWNLYVAPTISALSTAVILIFINRRFSSADKKDELIESLLAEKEQIKECAAKERWQRFDSTMCSVKTTVEGIKEDLSCRVSATDCNNKHDAVWEAINGIKDKVFVVRT